MSYKHKLLKTTLLLLTLFCNAAFGSDAVLSQDPTQWPNECSESIHFFEMNANNRMPLLPSNSLTQD